MEEIGAAAVAADAAAVLGEKLSLVIVTNINFPDFEFVNPVDLTKVVASFHNFNLKLEEKANNLELNFRGWKKNILSLCLVCGWLGYQRARSITWVGRTHKGKCKAFSTIKVKLGQNYLLSVPEKGFLDILHFHFLSFRDPSHLF